MKNVKNISNNTMKTIKNISKTIENNIMKTIKNIYYNEKVKILFVICVVVKLVEHVQPDVRKVRNVKTNKF